MNMNIFFLHNFLMTAISSNILRCCWKHDILFQLVRILEQDKASLARMHAMRIITVQFKVKAHNI